MADQKDIFVATAEEASVLRQVISLMRSGRLGAPVPLSVEEPPLVNSNDIFIAKIPTGGIPALEEPVGTSSTDYASPGYADCEIYRIDVDNTIGTGSGPGAYVLKRSGFTRRVFNLSSSVINGPYTGVKLDNYGRWLADGGGGAARFCTFTLTAALATTDAAGSGKIVQDSTGVAANTAITLKNVPDGAGAYLFSGSANTYGGVAGLWSGTTEFIILNLRCDTTGVGTGT